MPDELEDILREVVAYVASDAPFLVSRNPTQITFVSDSGIRIVRMEGRGIGRSAIVFRDEAGDSLLYQGGDDTAAYVFTAFADAAVAATSRPPSAEHGGGSGRAWLWSVGLALAVTAGLVAAWNAQEHLAGPLRDAIGASADGVMDRIRAGMSGTNQQKDRK